MSKLGIDREREHIHTCLQCSNLIEVVRDVCDFNADHDFELCATCASDPMIAREYNVIRAE